TSKRFAPNGVALSAIVNAPRVESRTISGVDPPVDTSYACCKVTLSGLVPQLEIWLALFRQIPTAPVLLPSVSTSSVDAKTPAPVTPSVPPRVVAPVPTVKVFDPVTEVLPFKLTAPVPVESVPEPVWATLPVKVAVPATSSVPVVFTLPFSRTVNLSVPPDLISRAVLVAVLVSSMINEGAVPALVRVKEVGVPVSVDSS